LVSAVGWIHDTGYGPAYEHEGFSASVLTSGALTNDPAGFSADEVVGWKSACECGWRSSLTYWRQDFPSHASDPPDSVGGAGRGGAWKEWRSHVFTTVPELVLADVVNVALRPTAVLDHPVVGAVVAIMRERGVPWSNIAEATGVTTRDAKWAWSQPRIRPLATSAAAAAPDGRPRAAAPRPDSRPRTAGLGHTPAAVLGR
jgi:hypothetical protein